MKLENHKTAQSLYGLTIAGTILCLLPFSLIPLAGAILLFVINCTSLIFVFTTKDPDFKSHCSYINWTYLWSVLILFVGIILFSLVMVSNGDFTPVNQTMDAIEGGIFVSMAQIEAMQNEFITLNLKLISVAMIIGFTPFFIYMIYRCVIGLKRLQAEKS